MVERKTHINYIKDVVYKFQIHTDDLLQRMNLSRERGPIGIAELKAALMHLDESLNQHKALKVAREIMDGKQQISMDDLVGMFNTVEESDKVHDASWFKDLLYKLRNELLDQSRMNSVKNQFEFFDEH